MLIYFQGLWATVFFFLVYLMTLGLSPLSLLVLLEGQEKKSFPSVGKLVPLDGGMVSPAQEHKMLPREALAEQAASVWVEERGLRPTGTEGLSRLRPFCVRIPLPASSPWSPSVSGWGR